MKTNNSLKYVLLSVFLFSSVVYTDSAYCTAPLIVLEQPNQGVALNQNSEIFKRTIESFTTSTDFKIIEGDLLSDQGRQEASDQHSMLMSAYIESAAAEDIFDFMEKRSSTVGPIVRYIDPQDDLAEPIWRTVNRKLTRGMVLTKVEDKFKNDLNRALSNLPPVAGISFRGAALDEQHLDTYQPGKVVEEKGFISTSLDLSIAQGFASPQPKKWSVIFIVKGKTGRLVSFFVPTNIHEAEILFRTSTRFAVNRVVKNADKRSATVWMLEI